MFSVHKRRNYGKDPLTWLSNMLYLRQIGHPASKLQEEDLSTLDAKPVENFHSIVRRATYKYQSAAEISKTGKKLQPVE